MKLPKQSPGVIRTAGFVSVQLGLRDGSQAIYPAQSPFQMPIDQECFESCVQIHQDICRRIGGLDCRHAGTGICSNQCRSIIIRRPETCGPCYIDLSRRRTCTDGISSRTESCSPFGSFGTTLTPNYGF